MRLWLLLLALIGSAVPAAQSGVTYDLVYVKAPRPVDRDGKFAEVFRPFLLEPNSDLVLRHPDGREEVLVDAPAVGAVADPFVSFDAQWVYYALFPDVTRINDYPVAPIVGSDIWKVNIATKQTVQLTHGEFTPNAAGAQAPISGPFNTGPTPLAGGRIAFVSNRNGFQPPKEYTPVTMQLFTMNDDGSDVEAIAPLTLGSVLHPFQLTDGRVCFSSFESQGLRDPRLWGYWCIWEDGRNWEPLSSAFWGQDVAQHFATQLSNGDVVIEGYYNLNNSGFGAMFKFPVVSPTAPIGFKTPFVAQQTDGVWLTVSGTSGARTLAKWPFQPVGSTAVTPFTHVDDRESPKINGVYQGKVTHPSGAPNNDLLLVWSSGPANSNGLHLPYVDSGIYLARNGVANTPGELVKIVDDPQFNEQWPRAVVPYTSIYGIEEPRRLPVNQNDGSIDAALPPATPYGIVGTASVFQRESFPGAPAGPDFDGLEAFYDSQGHSNFISQGSDVGTYTNEDLASVRIIALEAHSARSPNTWRVPLSNERARILGDAPLNADGSFAAKVPADTPFTFQLIDTNGNVVTTAQTWHQVRPGEKRIDCGGCHSHSKTPLSFATSIAAGKPPIDMLLPAHDVEFVKDIRPILQAKCARCHTATGPAPRLDSTAPATTGNARGLPLDYAVLAANTSEYGGPKAVYRSWNLTGSPNVSRWVRAGQSRRSLLAWMLAGKRLDGWTNERFPTETTPGDPTTLPAGASALSADLDYRIDHSMYVTDAERRAVFAWIDLFVPIDTGGGFFTDETRPAVTATNSNGRLLVGATDAYSGLKAGSLAVTVNRQAATCTTLPGSRWDCGALPSGASRVLLSARDNAGNLTSRSLTLVATAPTPIPTPTPTPTPLPAPKNLRFESGATVTSSLPRPGFPFVLYPALKWDAVPGAVAYQVTLTWSSGRSIMQMPVMGLNGAPLPLGMPGHQYKASVQGCTVLPPSPCDGAVSAVITVER